MKNIILILISILLILSGCSTPSYTEQDLLDASYRLDEDSNTMSISFGNSSVLVELDDNGVPSAIGMDHAITSYQSVNLRYVFTDELWSASYTDDKEVEVEPNDAYAYMAISEPQAAQELLELAKSNNISTKDLKNGNTQVINILISPDLIISNVDITDSTYTNPDVGDNFLYAMHYIQVNFDLTNDTNEEINLGEAELDICFTIEGSYECTYLETIEPSDTDLTTKILKPDETFSIKLKAYVPTSASEYDIGIMFDGATLITQTTPND